MATTQNTYTGNGSTTNYSFTFEYLKQSDVKVTLDTVATTAFSFVNATTLGFNTAPANNVAIRIFRDTAIDNLSSTFFPGSAIKAEDLNNNFTQNLYVTQEADTEVAAANTTASSAVVTAGQANTKADNAVETANDAETKADTAVATATQADDNATLALTNSRESDGSGGYTSAISKATTAVNTSTTASDNATIALNNSRESDGSGGYTSAISKATSALDSATTAVTTANQATAAASAAQQDADDAEASAVAAQNSATQAAASAAEASNISDAFTATGSPATALSVDVPIDAANGVKLPTNANSYDQEGAIRYNTTLDKIEIRKGSGWNTAAGGATVSATPPTLASSGDVWYDHDNGRAYVYYNDGDSNQWVEMNPSWNGYVADNSVTSAKIVDGTIVNADINASTSIDGTKISPDFGSQNVLTTGNGTFSGSVQAGGNAQSGTAVGTRLNSYGAVHAARTNDSDVVWGGYKVGNSTPTSQITANGSTYFAGNMGVGSSTINLPSGIGLQVYDSSAPRIKLANSTTGTGATDGSYLYVSGDDFIIENKESANMRFYTSATEKMRLNSSGRLLVGTTETSVHPDRLIEIGNTSRSGTYQAITTSSSGIGGIVFADTVTNDTGGYRGLIQYFHSDDAMVLKTSSVEALRIDSSGRLLLSGGSDVRMELGTNGTTGTNDRNHIRADGDNLKYNTCDSGNHIFEVNGSEKVRYDSSGNVTIGPYMTSPYVKGMKLFPDNGGRSAIVLNGDGADADAIGIYNGNSSSYILRLRHNGSATFGPFNNASASGYGANINMTANAAQIRAQIQSTGSGVTDLFSGFHGTSNNFHVLANGGAFFAGNLGIGSTNPLAKLHIQSTNNQDAINLAGYNCLKWNSSNVLHYGGYDSGQWQTLTFNTDGSERLRITSAGSALFGKTSDASTTAGVSIVPTGTGYTRFVNATSDSGATVMIVNRQSSNGTLVTYKKADTTVGTITCDSSSTAYNTSSDYRLKENVVNITDAVTRVKQLSPKRFNFIVDPDTTVDGFLAHEAQQVVPEAVTGEKDGEEMQGIDQAKLVPLLTAALQEAIAKIETLETKVAQLEANN